LLTDERERGRNQSVNGAFQVLRDLIPTENMDRKMSKIETLRLATKYILHLSAYINSGRGVKSLMFLHFLMFALLRMKVFLKHLAFFNNILV